MNYTISTNDAIDWNAQGIDRILQNVRNLINTWKYEIAFDRIRGIDSKIIDLPANKAQSLYISELYKIINRYEPRVTIQQVIFQNENQSDFSAKVVINI